MSSPLTYNNFPHKLLKQQIRYRGIERFLVRNGKDCDEHGEPAVHIQQPENDENPPKNDHAVLVEHYGEEGHHYGDNDENLGHLQPPGAVGGVVEDDVGQRILTGHAVMCEGQAECCHEKTEHEKKEAEDSFMELVREKKFLLSVLNGLVL